jgi:hypothetical protein
MAVHNAKHAYLCGARLMQWVCKITQIAYNMARGRPACLREPKMINVTL